MYHYQSVEDYDDSKEMYMEIVRQQAIKMQQEVYGALRETYEGMEY